jgi:hypothetical protein
LAKGVRNDRPSSCGARFVQAGDGDRNGDVDQRGRLRFHRAGRHAGEIWIRPRSLEGNAALREGQRVEYLLALGSLGVEAANVRPLDA